MRILAYRLWAEQRKELPLIQSAIVHYEAIPGAMHTMRPLNHMQEQILYLCSYGATFPQMCQETWYPPIQVATLLSWLQTHGLVRRIEHALDQWCDRQFFGQALDEPLPLLPAHALVPLLLEGVPVISVANLRCMVSRFCWSEREGTYVLLRAVNWEALEARAANEVKAQGGSITLSGIYACSNVLAQAALWGEQQP